jgi:hypothetical protein
MKYVEKDIRLSEYQDEGHQFIRASGETFLVSWFPDDHFLIPCYPDNLGCHTGFVTLAHEQYLRR